MPQTIVIELPDETVARYRQKAMAARKPIEEFLADRLAIDLSAEGKISWQRGDLEPASLSHNEAELLQRINAGFSGEEWAIYRRLIDKRRTGTLQPDEQQMLVRLADKREQANAQRIQALVALAQIRNTTLDALMADLGLRSPGYE